MIRPVNLRCEYYRDPLGIDEPAPRLSWTLEAVEEDLRGQRQLAYRIQVASDPELLEYSRPDLWDSAKTTSDQTSQIAYAGERLRSRQQCYWQVRAWDQDDEESERSDVACWTMGLLEESDWQAQWIGYDAPPHASGKLAGEPEQLSFERCSWIWRPDTVPPGGLLDTACCFRRRLQLPEAADIRRARFLIAAADQFVCFANGREVGSSDGEEDAWDRPLVLDLGEYLQPGDNILAVQVTTALQAAPGLAGKLVVEAGEETVVLPIDASWLASAEGEGEWHAAAFDDGGWLAAAPVGEVGMPPRRVPGGSDFLILPPPPCLRREFNADKAVRRATVYATALGLYELHLNGERLGHDYFTPGWCDYRQRVYYNTYDATAAVQAGANALAATLADGWYAGYVGFRLERRRYDGEPRLCLQLEIEYDDDSRETITTDDAWRAAYGPYASADFLMGAYYDARRELGDWRLPGYDDAAWKPAPIDPSITTPRQAYPGNPVRRVAELPARSMATPMPGVYVFDLGQNMVGRVRLKVRSEAGAKIVLRHGEMLRADGRVYTENLRSALATDTYVAKGAEMEVWEPQFTFHGFRYVELTGYPGQATLESVTGLVLQSDTPPAAAFETSSKLVNRLYENIVWGQRGNYLEVPTDCPQRDERLGWTGDAQAFVRTAAYNADVAAFFRKWMVDVMDAQTAEGVFTNVAPNVLDDGHSPAWGDAGVICPYVLYQTYGDRRLLERCYPGMVRYLDYLQRTSDNLLRPATGFGDWLAVGADSPKDVLATIYFAHVAQLMAAIAEVLELGEDARSYAKLAADIDAAFNDAFVDDDGRIHGETQTIYALALNLDLLPEPKRELAVEHLVGDIERRGNHLSTGFLGAKEILPALTRFGRVELAYRLLLNRSYPSWGYSIRHGATTIWERWNGWTETEGYGNASMNSFNHYAFGAVGEWLFSAVGGIESDGPAFKRARVRPRPGPGLEHVTVRYESMHGPYAVEWGMAGRRFAVKLEIPVNASVTLFLPALADADLMEASQPLAESEGVELLRRDGNAAVLQMGSGSYIFSSTFAGAARTTKRSVATQRIAGP